jgi:hypothetical protein
MITFEIKRYGAVPATPPEIHPEAKGLFTNRKAAVPALPGPAIKAPPEKPGLPPIGMGKVQYARWLGEYVYHKFAKGVLVTLAEYPFVLGELPKQWFRVKEIQELHYVAQYDHEHRQPKCVGVANATLDRAIDYHTYYAPAALRPLTQEEVLVLHDRLRNKKGDGRDDESKGVDPTAGNEQYAG